VLFGRRKSGVVGAYDGQLWTRIRLRRDHAPSQMVMRRTTGMCAGSSFLAKIWSSRGRVLDGVSVGAASKDRLEAHKVVLKPPYPRFRISRVRR
jgi:hypothetical protein